MKRLKKQQFSLVELLAIIAVMALLMGGLLALFHKVYRQNVRATKQAWRAQDLSVIKKRWRKQILEFDSKVISFKNGTLSDFECEAKVKGNQILFKKGDTLKKIDLAKGINAAIGLEANDDESKFAILTISWRDKKAKGKKGVLKKYRIVARPGKKKSESKVEGKKQ